MTKPKWWDTDCTIYNKLETAEGEIQWYRHYIYKCFWKYVHDKVTIGETILETNQIICRIPEDSKYLSKAEWKEKSAAEKPNFFTLGVGDIIVNGISTDDIDEYTAGHRSSDLIKKHKELGGCMVIDTVTINTPTGIGLHHYLAKGI